MWKCTTKLLKAEAKEINSKSEIYIYIYTHTVR